ncbi:MAG: carbohydrate ABC transporter permease [Clostridia bacterium]|nr:carbohydrate ABC transporter permease [Clostridia bacterium]
MKKKLTVGRVLLNLVMIIMSLGYVIPILLMLAISFSSEQSIIDNGYQLIPAVWSADAYRQALSNPHQIINAYKVTIAYTVLGTVLSILVQTLMAYPLSRSNYNKKKFVTVYLMITMFFGGGLVPSYILNTQYLHLGNTFWIYIFPGLMSAWNVILFKTYFKGLPNGLVEAAKLDGASEFYVYLKIILPLSTPIIACIAFTTVLGKWNDWNTSLLYIRNSDLYSLQYLLQRIINESDFIKNMQGTAAAAVVGETLPSETLKYAIAILAAGPMMVVFPFFQKYFAKGLVVGSVKG